MVLSGAGDALGFRNEMWEFNFSGPAIHKELQQLGGLKNIKVKLPDWPVSDDTVLHLATAEGLATGKAGEDLLHEVAARYMEAMKDLEGRAPGRACSLGISQLRPGEEGGFRVPYNPRGTGCGAAMRSMCIGLRYPKPDQLSTLVAVAVVTGRMTHPLDAELLSMEWDSREQGDSDSTAVIAACCWGLLCGTKGVPEGNFSSLEYRERLERCAEQLYVLSH
ncbi:ADP-ribosylhydrolase ARH1-like [Synchiropus picturatus]